MEYFTEARWSPYVMGLGIGMLRWFSFFIFPKPLACLTTFARASGLLGRLQRGPQVAQWPYGQKIKIMMSAIVTGMIDRRE